MNINEPAYIRGRRDGYIQALKDQIEICEAQLVFLASTEPTEQNKRYIEGVIEMIELQKKGCVDAMREHKLMSATKKYIERKRTEGVKIKA